MFTTPKAVTLNLEQMSTVVKVLLNSSLFSELKNQCSKSSLFSISALLSLSALRAASRLGRLSASSVSPSTSDICAMPATHAAPCLGCTSSRSVPVGTSGMSAVESPCERAPSSNGYNFCSGHLNRVGFL